MDHWTDFFLAEAGAAAALAGLLVVAISINVDKILSFAHLPSRAAQTLVLIGAALVLASFGLFPDMTEPRFGWISLALAAALTLIGLRGFLRSWAGARVLWSVTQLVTVLTVSAPLALGAALLLNGNGAGMDWVAVSIIMACVAALQSGWVLMIEILR